MIKKHIDCLINGVYSEQGTNPTSQPISERFLMVRSNHTNITGCHHKTIVSDKRANHYHAKTGDTPTPHCKM